MELRASANRSSTIRTLRRQALLDTSGVCIMSALGHRGRLAHGLGHYIRSAADASERLLPTPPRPRARHAHEVQSTQELVVSGYLPHAAAGTGNGAAVPACTVLTPPFQVGTLQSIQPLSDGGRRVRPSDPAPRVAGPVAERPRADRAPRRRAVRADEYSLEFRSHGWPCGSHGDPTPPSRNSASSAGPTCHGHVKIRWPRIPPKSVAPRTWSSRPWCFQEGGLSGRPPCRDWLPPIVGSGRFGG